MWKRLFDVMMREIQIIHHNRIYGMCMVFFPLLTVVFFTTLLDEGLPQSLPVAVVDLDNTSTTRSLAHRLDGFQMTDVVAHYPSVAEARNAMQRNEIYGFLYIPKGTTDDLLANRQPKISFYYSNTSLSAGSMVMKDLKTISTLGSAAVGQAMLKARGATDAQIQTALQPITVDLHQISNPWSSYNSYLTTMMVPGLFMLFISLISAYSLGNELKFNTSKEWVKMADGNMLVALIGKFLPQLLVYLAMVFFYEWYVFLHLGFPHNGSAFMLVLLALMQVLAAQGFGIFVFGLMPSLRMSMSVCSLWSVLSFSMCGAAFPLMAMDAPLQSLSWLFPLRHYFMLYQICVFNGYPLLEAWFHFVALVAFMMLPWLVVKKIKNAMLYYVYIP
ncbi:ABC transporter permease [Prevotella sp. E9-3]|uniref:ABC transporter permease n=1 Tax=Prevotella sp. E9-3 TaxID=2913621 RepID=UPI001EDA7FB5|nr:ABC transporter permease [Prevotella sp. E9-3]UKK47677.1 ABC transporter permease [Prevotella sp. E9-3]